MADRDQDNIGYNVGEDHLEVYNNRSELHTNNTVSVYYEGLQTIETQRRYTEINDKLRNGYLEDMWNSLGDVDFSELSEYNMELIQNLVDGITSEVGRALVEVAFLQMAIKAICPNQSVRLHKGTTRRGSFSWKDGISMRTLDASFTIPFLKKYGLLSLNKYGAFMTRSLAENYPYSKLYKADMRGPFDKWMEIVDALENETMPAYLALCYLTVQLKNRSDSFNAMAENAVLKASEHEGESFSEIESLLINFVNSTEYSARAFEVVIHGFMQSLYEHGMLGDLELVPLSQMRSANKKHGNIGDIELKDGEAIVESWDAKYGKPYLRDEVEEVVEKLSYSPAVKVAGFIVDRDVDRRRDVIERAEEIEAETGVEIPIYSFDEWIDSETEHLKKGQLDEIGFDWLIAVVESFAQRRRGIAPIDEPCDQWLDDLIEIL